MQEKVLKSSPGVIVGISTTKRYKGSVTFYDGHKLVAEVELAEPMPSERTTAGVLPGAVIDTFCKKSIRAEYPKGVKIEFFIS